MELFQKGETYELEYETGEKKIFDVLPYAKGSWYSKLKDKNYFKTVHIVNNGYGIEWAGYCTS